MTTKALYHLLDRSASRFPSNTAIEESESGSIDYEELARLSDRVYGQLDLGILTSIEHRSTSVFTAGFLPLLTLGARL